jgi:hypothetical protein
VINIIADDNSIIPYRKELNEITGCVTASILLSQLLYWWKKSGGEFYKFKEPCKHEKYTEGDSWCEELGYTRKQFDTAFKKLKDKGFVSNRITIDRLTYYSVDERTLGKALKGLYETTETDFTKSDNSTLVYKEAETTTETTADNKYKAAEYYSSYWNGFDDLTKCRKVTDKIQSAINGLNSDGYDHAAIVSGINNYVAVLRNPSVYRHEFNFLNFLKQTNGCRKFSDMRNPDTYMVSDNSRSSVKTNITFAPRPAND